MNLNDILSVAMKKGASDVHLKAGIVPVIRKHGKLRPLSTKLEPITDKELESMAYGLMDAHQRKHFETKKDIDMGYGIPGLARFRINIFQQRGSIRMVIRNIPHVVPTLEELALPEIIKKIADNERGLVLVTGATGSGKSSTLAAIVDHINKTKNKHILMIEDPTEYLIRDRKSLITQRELGTDTISFSDSLRAALRQDPDVILIGEMRDRETIEIALVAAETGHLVLSTLHTIDAQESVNRILATFEPHQQGQIRLQLASVLKAIISQRLIRKIDNKGFVPAIEILMNNKRVREMIEDPARTIELISAIEEGQVAYEMQSFDQSLMKLVDDGLINYDEALKNSSSPENFAIRYSGVEHMDGKKWNSSTTQPPPKFDGKWNHMTTIELEASLADNSEEKTTVSPRKSGIFPLKKKRKR